MVALSIGKSNDSATGTQAEARLEGRMGFSSFNITRVLQQGKALLGSAGDEYDLEPDSELINLSQSERAARYVILVQSQVSIASTDYVKAAEDSSETTRT